MKRLCAVLILAGCSRQVPPEAASATVTSRLSPAQLDAFDEPTHSACMGPHGAPVVDYDAGECRVRGPYAGELTGQAVGEPAALEAALARCIADEECTGVSASWYIGADFSAVRAERPFVEDTNSYGCVVLVACP